MMFSAFFASMLSMQNMFKPDFQNGTIEQLMLFKRIVCKFDPNKDHCLLAVHIIAFDFDLGFDCVDLFCLC